ncbi:terminase small subunit [Patescibacteria group bacterium]|nr:terminase small subunit [Patescibacteria group bacterium]
MSQLLKFRGLDYKNYELNLKQKLFCDGYLKTKGDSISAVEGAGYKVNGNRKLASSIASENLTKPNICAYLNLKLKEYGFDDGFVEKQLLFLINQFSNLRVKLSAIDTYYKLKGKYAPNKLDINRRDGLDDLSDEELTKLAFGEDYEPFMKFKAQQKAERETKST